MYGPFQTVRDFPGLSSKTVPASRPRYHPQRRGLMNIGSWRSPYPQVATSRDGGALAPLGPAFLLRSIGIRLLSSL